MSNQDSVFITALTNLLVEVFDGPPGQEAFILNPGDPGLVRQLESLSPEMVSSRPIPGKTTIAAHADHVHYGLALLNRWAAGEANPWATADWNASWQRTKLDATQWKELCQRLREASHTWQRSLGALKEWDALSGSGALASVAHAAYHLGAIRQILAAMNANTAPQ